MYDLYSMMGDHLSYLWGLLVFLVWPVIRLVAQPQRLMIMTGSALANMFMRASTIRGMRQAIDYRMLPVNPKASTARSHYQNAVNAGQRMREYRDMRRTKKADREGPYALQQFIEDLYDQDFQRWQRMLKDHLVEFDRREEIVHRKLYKLKWRTDFIWQRFEAELDEREAALIRLRVRWAYAINHLQRERTLRGFWRRLAVVRKCRRDWKALHRVQAKRCKLRDRQVRKLEKQANLVLKPYLGWLHDFEMLHLVNNVPVAQADWASAQQTVELGRTLERLANVRSARTRDVRALLKLEHLPETPEALMAFVKDGLRGRVGLNPNSQDEDILETWLRVYYTDLGAEGCPDLPPLGPKGFHLWVVQLVPPGAKGLAHGQFGHLSAHGGAAWLAPAEKGRPRAAAARAKVPA